MQVLVGEAVQAGARRISHGRRISCCFIRMLHMHTQLPLLSLVYPQLDRYLRQSYDTQFSLSLSLYLQVKR